MNLPVDFQTFYEKIELGETQTTRINSAAGRIRQHLLTHYSLNTEDVFPQGSYPNGTAVKPDPEDENGEYDVDLVSVSAAADASPEEALQDLEDALSKDADLDKRIERTDRKTPCVRLRYADDPIGSFHVDVTPARPHDGEASLEIPRRGLGWQPTSPAEYTQWGRDEGTDFARLVQMLKRWRDHHLDARQAVRSIVLQVLIAENRVHGGDDARAVAGTLRAISNTLAESPESPPAILNPVLPAENLAGRWPHEDYRDFRDVVDKTAILADRALADTGLNESRTLWRQLFGNDFPAPEEPGAHSRPTPPEYARAKAQGAPPRVEWG